MKLKNINYHRKVQFVQHIEVVVLQECPLSEVLQFIVQYAVQYGTVHSTVHGAVQHST